MAGHASTTSWTEVVWPSSVRTIPHRTMHIPVPHHAMYCTAPNCIILGNTVSAWHTKFPVPYHVAMWHHSLPSSVMSYCVPSSHTFHTVRCSSKLAIQLNSNKSPIYRIYRIWAATVTCCMSGRDTSGWWTTKLYRHVHVRWVYLDVKMYSFESLCMWDDGCTNTRFTSMPWDVWYVCRRTISIMYLC